MDRVGLICLFVSAAISSLGFAADAAQSLQASLTTTLGTSLDKTQPATSLTLEPEMRLGLSANDTIRFYSSVDRPTDPYQNFAVPLTVLEYRRQLVTASPVEVTARPRLSLLNLHRWAADGSTLRTIVGINAKVALSEQVSLAVSVSPYLQFSAYRQSTAGVTFPRHGLTERATLAWTSGRTTIELDLILEQSQTSVWKNSYTTAQAVSYELDNTFSLGLSHELGSSIVDESTGRSRDISFFDSRKSRISGFLGVAL